MPRRKGAAIDFLEFQLFRVARFLESLERMVRQVAEGQDALDQGIQTLQTTADDVKASIDKTVTVITALVTKLQSQPNAPDFTSEIQELQTISDELSSGKSALDTADATGDQAANIGSVGAATPAAPTPGIGDAATGSGATSAENPETESPAEDAGETAEETGSGEAPPIPPPPGT